MGRDDVVAVLKRNLEVEQHTLDEAKEMQRKVAASAPQAA